MQPSPPHTLAEWRDAYRAGASPGVLLEAARRRIEAASPIAAWISRADAVQLGAQVEALARREAGFADRTAAMQALPLFGVPFAVKDNIDVDGLATTAGCPAFAFTPARHATVVQKLVDAGAVCVGKTNLDQFATGLVGTRSPYGRPTSALAGDRISGGSSSGSAVAVALGLVAFALGTDTAGSGRVPAAFNNIVGLKPTRGAISARGVVPACRSLDCVSIFAHDCADAVEVLRVARGYDREDPYSRRSEAGMATIVDARRFAVPREREFCGDREYARLFEETIERLCALGFEALEVDYAPFLEVQRLLYEGPWLAERCAAIGEFATEHPDALDPIVRSILERAASLSAVDAFKGAYRLAELKRGIEGLWEQVPVLLVPAAPTIYTIAQIEADPVALNSRLGWYTNFVNLLDLAAVNVPAGLRVDGLPFGVSLIGPAHAEETLANIGGRVHAALGMWSGAMPRAYQPAAAPAAPVLRSHVHLAVVGAHLSGLPLNGQLTERRARLLACARTAPCYRLYALDDGAVPRPGMVRSRAGEGGAIEVEVWELAVEQFGSFVAEVAPPLGIGTIELENGEPVKGFVCEHYAVQGKIEITQWGGWRSWLAHLREPRSR